jgi:Ribosomal protein L7/L12 C-terminal domain
MRFVASLAVKEFYKAGKIPLIKFVRAISFLGLKEAKEWVESEMESNNLKFPAHSPYNFEQTLQHKDEQIRILNERIESLKNRLRDAIDGY